MSETNRLPTLEDISAALAVTDGKTPAAVVGAFLERPVKVHGKRMAPYKAGHDLLFSDLGHPWATGKTWDGRDVLMALFVCSHESRELFQMVKDDTFESNFFGFIEEIDSTDLTEVCRELVAHLARSRRTALSMESPHAGPKKKAAASAGGLTRSPLLARCMAGLRTLWSTSCRSRNSSR